MNEVINAITDRRSIKKYKSTPVPQDKLDRILQSATYTASGKNRQAAIMICVTNKELRDKLSALNAKILGTDIDPFYGAPAVVVVLADMQYNTAIYDGSLVMGNLMLAAYSEGVDSCWIHRAKEMFESEEGKKLLAELGIEGSYQGIGNCVLGYRDCEYPAAKPRKENYIYYVK